MTGDGAGAQRSRVEKERKRRNKGVALFLRDIAVIVVAALEIAFLLKTSLVRSFLIKRVIGLPGDTVECCDEQGRLLVNGEPIDEPYLDNPSLGASPPVQDGPGPFSVTVPVDSTWVMGVNRAASADSRSHIVEPSGGFVPIDDIVGRAILITFPSTASAGSTTTPRPSTLSTADEHSAGVRRAVVDREHLPVLRELD